MPAWHIAGQRSAKAAGWEGERVKEISLHILDLAQNSIRAGAKNVRIRIEEDSAADTFSVSIADDGCGMEPELARAAQNPFVTTRTTRKVGLGLPLFLAGCENCEGSFRLESEPGRGTCVAGTYRRSHIDRPPLGNIADTVAMLIAANPCLRLRYEHRLDGGEYALDTAKLGELLGGIPLDAPKVMAFITEFIHSSESELESMEVHKP